MMDRGGLMGGLLHQYGPGYVGRHRRWIDGGQMPGAANGLQYSPAVMSHQ